MKKSGEENLNDIEKIKNYLVELEFRCQSDPLSQNLIYSKKDEVIIIKNKDADKK